ncbi:MAG: hypothetical protein SCM11_07705 [Bacillota bacterium]|nr:hypothetical protein [Bacillota bacterium]
MWLFGKKKNVPAWASFFNEIEYAAFTSALDSILRDNLNIVYEICDGVAVFAENEYNFENLGLLNLAQLCKKNQSDEYPQIVEGHFKSMIEANRFQKEFEKIEANFDQIKQYIAVRLYDEKYMASVGKLYFIGKEFVGELFAAIVFDLPYTIINIKPEQIKPWNKSINELYGIGLENVRNKYVTSVKAIDHDNDVLYACEAGHLFATNILFDIERHNLLAGKAGSLIAVPNRCIALIYPINDLKVVGMVKSLCLTVPKLYDNNPGALTKEIYWYMSGNFIMLPYESTRKGVSFSPPDEFIQVLNNLEAVK